MTTLDQAIAQRLAHLRGQQRLSLAQLAERAGVSKAMISKIERQDSSPTAAVLGRLASGLGVSLSQLLAEDKAAGASALRRKAEQDTWRDPASGYVRRQVAELDSASGSELVEIDLPPGQRIDYPCWHSQAYRQRLWVVAGTLVVTYGEDRHVMEAGDQFDFAVDRPVSYLAQGTRPCRYLLNILHRSAPA